MSDLYAMLEVTRDASDDEIKKSYRRLAMLYHPDRNASADAEARFKEIAEAYQVLSDPDKRAHYDRFGTAPSGGAGFGPGSSTSTCPKRSTSSCATSGSADWMDCSAAGRNAIPIAARTSA